MISINIAVTGHRDIREDNLSRCRESIGNVISDIMTKYPNSPINIQTGMAEGADMTAAEEALRLGCNLTAVLPFKAEEYVETFEKPENAERLRLLLRKADKIIYISDEYPNSEADRRYALLGEYLVGHSHMLIALWDGSPSGGHGGTGDVVRSALEGIAQNTKNTDAKISVFYIRAERVKKRATLDRIDYLKDESHRGYSILYPKEFASIEKAEAYYAEKLYDINKDKCKS